MLRRQWTMHRKWSFQLCTTFFRAMQSSAWMFMVWSGLDSLSGGGIAGIVIAVVVVFVLAAAIVVVVIPSLRKKLSQRVQDRIPQWIKRESIQKEPAAAGESTADKSVETKTGRFLSTVTGIRSRIF